MTEALDDWLDDLRKRVESAGSRVKPRDPEERQRLNKLLAPLLLAYEEDDLLFARATFGYFCLMEPTFTSFESMAYSDFETLSTIEKSRVYWTELEAVAELFISRIHQLVCNRLCDVANTLLNPVACAMHARQVAELTVWASFYQQASLLGVQAILGHAHEMAPGSFSCAALESFMRSPFHISKARLESGLRCLSLDYAVVTPTKQVGEVKTRFRHQARFLRERITALFEEGSTPIVRWLDRVIDGYTYCCSFVHPTPLALAVCEGDEQEGMLVSLTARVAAVVSLAGAQLIKLLVLNPLVQLPGLWSSFSELLPSAGPLHHHRLDLPELSSLHSGAPVNWKDASVDLGQL